ncbi:glutathione S-transferase family protein [Enterovibrio sp. ZSDZ42]|uniref:Glutathione S-transferase family protein n=1 Tax=Enterovibrio gelatinilyticus TaxID=2899819 RepID=A0ABT5R051_9GAMM|nr:glutathione S-transferase family protein [Enterovibrio sp. ZSDZ42]MDD1793653.1 glutathione S-transferase family protein [Enterovibrio sp. ZSDZ42]
MKLIIANKNYSTWSLRGWLVLRGFDIAFDEVELELFTESFYAEIAKHSGAAKVPVLVDGPIEVWDSLAICEYVNDQYLGGKGWPGDIAQRAKARAFSAEMHSGFQALRNEMPMNIRGRRKISPSEACLKDVARIDEIWAGQRQEFGNKGGWLFGEFSIADVMYAPVVLRFITYGVALSPDAQAYADHVLNSAAVQQWVNESKSDTSVVAEDEAGTEIS